MKTLSWIRLLSLLLFLYHTVSVEISWASLLTGVLLLVSLYVLKEPLAAKKSGEINFGSNPLKGKPKGVSIEDIPADLCAKINQQISDLVTYDATDCEAVQEFEMVKSQTECIFAKKSKIWGSCDWDSQLSLETNIYKCVPTLLKFVNVCGFLGLDGFVIMLPGEEFGSNLQTFGQAVRRVLAVVSSLDPAGIHCMSKSYINRRGWVFQFNKCTMFVTTFAPLYPSNHPRYAFGSKNCFILLQPELSFAQHDLCPDTPHTNWDEPKTVRDRIRVAFRDAGREYKIRDTVYYPMVEDIVKPVESDSQYIEWWRKIDA